MAIEIFSRYEKKYMINENILQKLQNKLSDYMELDGYNKQNEMYSINNIYYDTDDNYLIRTSLSKPKYKEKLRIRSYGVAEENSKVYLEIKKKVFGRTNKRRSLLKLKEAYSFLETGIIPDLKSYMNKQILMEIEYLINLYHLKPKVYLAYDRIAYFAKGQHDLRISFDTNIRTRRTDLKLESRDYGHKLLDKGNWLMEIKAENTMPIWLVHLLSEFQIYPTSFSKYGEEYKRLLQIENNLNSNQSAIAI